MTIIGNKQLFPLISMPIETQPKVRVLQQWFSKMVLPWNLAKQFVHPKSVFDFIRFEEGVTTRKETFNKAKLIKGELKHTTKEDDGAEDTIKYININGNEKIKLSLWVWTGLGGGKGIIYTIYIEESDNYGDVSIEFDDAPKIDAIQNLILNMLSYTYNYYKNFDGASYDSDNNPNEMAKLKEKFQANKPEDVISNLFEQWKLEYPKYANDNKVNIFRQIIAMLSCNIISKHSINNGQNDDVKLLFPYYFELVSVPIQIDAGKPWKFQNCEVVLKSKYFDFSNSNNIKILNKDISQNELFKLNDNQFNWMSIPNQLETNDIPSLLPSDLTLANGEYGKYLTRLIIRDEDINFWLDKFGSGNSGLFSKLEWFNFKEQIENDFILRFDKELININRIEISAIFADGNYEITFIDSSNKEIININNLKLFSSIDESLSSIALEI